MTIRFRCNHDGGKIVLRVSTGALDRAFAATDPEFYRSVSTAKVDRMLSWPDGARLQAPIVGAHEGRLSFQNGRHRARAALLQGSRTIPVIVDRDNADEVLAVLAKFTHRAGHKQGRLG